jgi:hypothetical protein
VAAIVALACLCLAADYYSHTGMYAALPQVPYAAVVPPADFCNATGCVLYPIDDTYVWDYAPYDVYGASQTMCVGFQQTYRNPYQSFLRFNLSRVDLPRVGAGELHIHLASMRTDWESGELVALQISSTGGYVPTWQEETANAHTLIPKNSYGADIMGYAVWGTTPLGTWYNTTNAIVKSRIAARIREGDGEFVLWESDPVIVSGPYGELAFWRFACFHTKEAGADYAPRLVVIYATTTTTTTTSTTTSTTTTTEPETTLPTTTSTTLYVPQPIVPEDNVAAWAAVFLVAASGVFLLWKEVF